MVSAQTLTDSAPPRRILVVDDEESVLRAVKRTLRRQGWDVATAVDASAGLQQLQQGPVQVVISDYKMPGMSGVEFLRQVKERYPFAQRIMLTGYADQQAIEDAINRSEVFRFVSKPWDDAHLTVTIASALEQYDLQEENRRLLALTLRQNEELTALTHSLEAKVAERTALLARAKKEWEVAFDAIERPIVVLSRALKVQRANLAWASMAQTPVTQVVGRSCYELFGRTAACEVCPLASGKRAPGPVEVSHRERTYQFVSYEANDSYVCLYRDTTEEKLLTRRMLQTEKLAAVGQLAAGVAHEINNPLGGILAFTQLMQRDPGRSAEDQEILKDVEHAALRCKKTVEGLLKFSRRSPSGKSIFDANRAAEDAMALFRAQLRSKPRATLESELSDKPLTVCGDPNQIEQVVLNFLVNALQALKGGEGNIKLRSWWEGAHVLLAVSDDGTGILPAHLPRLFEPTFTTKPPGEGTGFGLAISWSIAETHEGTILVDSEPGKGSTFTLKLPGAVPADSDDTAEN